MKPEQIQARALQVLRECGTPSELALLADVSRQAASVWLTEGALPSGQPLVRLLARLPSEKRIRLAMALAGVDQVSGLVIVLPEEQVNRALAILQAAGLDAWHAWMGPGLPGGEG